MLARARSSSWSRVQPALATPITGTSSVPWRTMFCRAGKIFLYARSPVAPKKTSASERPLDIERQRTSRAIDADHHLGAGRAFGRRLDRIEIDGRAAHDTRLATTAAPCPTSKWHLDAGSFETLQHRLARANLQ